MYNCYYKNKSKHALLVRKLYELFDYFNVYNAANIILNRNLIDKHNTSDAITVITFT